MGSVQHQLTRARRLCQVTGCGQYVVLVRTQTGRFAPVNEFADAAGRIAVRVAATGLIVGRTLTDDRPDPEGLEELHIAHQATCGERLMYPQRADGVVPLYAARAARAARRQRGEVR